jgi:hypothetical protein
MSDIEKLRELLSCAEAWEPDARLLGNLRAADIRASLQIAISALAEFERLRAALRWYGDPANHYTIPPKTSYDPAYIFVAEPPIFQDSGRRARKALRGEGR